MADDPPCPTTTHRITWTHDPTRGVWDGEAPGGRSVCVARDGRGAMPWGAYHTRSDGPGQPDSWHRTMREAQAACEEAIGRG